MSCYEEVFKNHLVIKEDPGGFRILSSAWFARLT